MQDATEFTITQVAEAVDIDLSNLRNRVRQNFLEYKGPEPRASYPRMFKREGVYEIAIIDELERHGLNRSLAADITHRWLKTWLEEDVEALANQILSPLYKQVKAAFEAHRDLSNPIILVLSLDCSGGYAQAYGQMSMIQGLPMALQAALDEGKHALLINLTSILFRVDQGLSRVA